MDSDHSSDSNRRVDFEYEVDSSRDSNINSCASKSHKRDIFEGSSSGAQPHPYVPRFRSDPEPYRPLERSLEEYRAKEGEEAREMRLRALWRKALIAEAETASRDVLEFCHLGTFHPIRPAFGCQIQ